MIKAIHILNENTLSVSGGLGVHVRDVSVELANRIDLVVVAVDYAFQQGGFYLVSKNKIKKVDYEDWKYTTGYYRLLLIFNTNEIITRYGFITKVISENMFIQNVLYYLAGEKFDIIHLHDSALWKVAKNLQALYRAQIILTCHLSFFLCHPKDPDSPYYMYDAAQEGTAFQTCSRLITVSQNYADRLNKEFFVRRDIDVILNGVDFDFLQTVKYNKELKAKYKGKKLIVFVGRLVPSKGVEVMFRVIKKMKDCHFILISSIAPSVEAINPLVEKIKKLKRWHKNFEWLNNLEQAKKWEFMKIADIGIMPSLHEPFGIVALEFMALQTPLMVSQVDGLEEFCNNENADIIEPNSKSVIRRIKNFKRNEIKLMSAYQTAKRMTWGKVTDGIMKIYDEVINGSV